MTANGFVQVSIPTKANWGFGQHFFIRFITLGIHAGSIHPFTVCSLPVTAAGSSAEVSNLVLYIRPRKGLTARLAQLATKMPGTQVRVLIDGPYGGVDSQKLVASQMQLIIAGGSGSGWLLPLLEAFLRTRRSSTALRRSAKIVLVTRDSTTQAWFEDTVAKVLQTYGLSRVPDNLAIELYYTGSDRTVTGSTLVHAKENYVEFPSSEAEKLQMPSDTSRRDSSSASSLEPESLRQVQCFSRRPDLKALVREETASTSSSTSQLGIFVCGPLSMQSDVSNAAADEQVAVMKGSGREIYLHMEHFSWA